MGSPEAGRVKALLAAGVAGYRDAERLLAEAVRLTDAAWGEAAGATNGARNPLAITAVEQVEQARAQGRPAGPLLAEAVRDAEEYRVGI